MKSLEPLPALWRRGVRIEARELPQIPHPAADEGGGEVASVLGAGKRGHEHVDLVAGDRPASRPKTARVRSINDLLRMVPY